VNAAWSIPSERDTVTYSLADQRDWLGLLQAVLTADSEIGIVSLLNQTA
jgi:hypothetical protein